MTETQPRAATSPMGSAAEEALSGGARKRRKIELRSIGELGALVALIAVFAALNPESFVTITNLRTILDQAAAPLIIGVGATLVILMGSIDLSVEGVMGAAGLTFVLLASTLR